MKKKLFILFFAVAFVATSIIGGFHYYSAQKEAQYAPTAVPYVTRVISELSKWDPEITRKYMSVESLEKTSDDRFVLIIKALSTLGPLQEMAEPEFAEIFSGNKQTVLTYTVEAKYSTGDAIITIGLSEKDGMFEVDSFNIQSEALAR